VPELLLLTSDRDDPTPTFQQRVAVAPMTLASSLLCLQTPMYFRYYYLLRVSTIMLLNN